MKAKLNFRNDKPVDKDGNDLKPGVTWEGHSGWDEAGTINEGPDAWKLCCIREINARSPNFGRFYAEPADAECAAITAKYREAERLEVLNRSGMTDIEADFKERFKLRDEEADAKAAATSEFEARLMEGV